MRRFVRRPAGFHDLPASAPVISDESAPGPDDPTDVGFDWSEAELDHLSTISADDIADTAAWLKRLELNEVAALFNV